MNLRKILSIVIILIAITGAVMYVMVFRNPEDSVSIMLHLGKVLVIITAAISLVFALKNIVSDGRKLKKTITLVIVFAVLAAIAYVMAKGVAIEEGDNTITARDSKLVGTGIYLFYLLAALAFLIMIFFGIRKTVK